MKKWFITVVLALISIVVLGSVGVMFAVNLGITNEKSGIGRHVSLEQNSEEKLKIQDIYSENKELESIGITVDKENKRDMKLKFCKKEVLTAVDNSLNFALESNVDILFSHVDLLVGNIKSELVYCVNSNKEGNYSYSTLKGMINSYIDPKFIDNVVSDVYNYDTYHYIRSFFDNSKTKDYFNKVIEQLDDIEADELESIIMIEQIRGTMTNRGFFKEMVKKNILQSFTDFSLGISGMKITTAIEIEKYLKDPNSEFYLGKKYETLLDYNLDNKKMSLQDKLTENKTYYYQYLYTGIAIKMIKKQWKERGYDLDGKLGIIATIYNLGLKKSNPNAYPGIGGAEINIDGKKWYFGELGEKIWISLQRYKG